MRVLLRDTCELARGTDTRRSSHLGLVGMDGHVPSVVGVAVATGGAGLVVGGSPTTAGGGAVTAGIVGRSQLLVFWGKKKKKT